MMLSRSTLVCGASLLSVACGGADPAIELDEVALVEVATVGVLEGDEWQEFGMVLDVRALADSSFLVLDPLAPSVSWFSADGRYLDGIRSRGEGPGELAQPHAFEVVSSRYLVVADRRNGRLNRYRFDGEGFVPVDLVRGNWFDFPAGRTICAVGDRRFVHQVRDGFLLHEVNDEWEPIRSFGPVAPVPRDELAGFAGIVLQVLNRGRLECLDSPPMLLWVSENLPYVGAFSVDGEPIWETEVSQMRPREVVLLPGVSLEVDPVEGSHEGRSLVRWSEDTLLLQYRLWVPEDKAADGDPWIMDSRLLSLSNGEELGRYEGLPRIMATSGDLVYALEEEPYPHVVVWSRDR